MATSAQAPAAGLGAKATQIEAGHVGHQAAGFALELKAGQLSGFVQRFVDGGYHQVGQHVAVLRGEQGFVDFELEDFAVAVGRLSDQLSSRVSQ